MQSHVCLYFLCIGRLLNADIPSAQDFPQHEDSATVSSASESSFSLAWGWLRDCLASHRLCSQIPDVDFAPPTRVIDIGLRDGKPFPRLYLSSSGDLNMKYVALSHCWGKTKTAILKKHMLRTMTRGIDWSWLPKTFQDALLVTRRLGFRYLWIDSLCIIQDSREDWIKESGTMQNVYANCVLTIAASWGKDSRTGLFIERKPLNQQPCRIFGNACTGCYIQPNLTDASKTAKEANPESLEKRAWAVQEKLLPARILSYRSFELQWDCLESHASESWPTGLRKRTQMLKAGGFRRYMQYGPENTALREISLLKTRSGRLGLNFMDSFYPHWHDILRKYSRAKLTYRSDVFVAFSGITKNIEKWTGLTNIFGIWKELLPVDLLWVCMIRSGKASRSSLCPTWSWASLVDVDVGMLTFLSGFGLVSRDAFDERYPVLISARTISLDQHSATSESHMTIEIQGPVFCDKVLPPSDDLLSGSCSILKGLEQSRVYLDPLGDHAVEDVFCLVIVERKKSDLASVGIKRLGLILARPDREKEDYIRIGVWEQEIFTKYEREIRRIRSNIPITTKEEDLALNAEDRTVFLI